MLSWGHIQCIYSRKQEIHELFVETKSLFDTHTRTHTHTHAHTYLCAGSIGVSTKLALSPTPTST